MIFSGRLLPGLASIAPVALAGALLSGCGPVEGQGSVDDIEESAPPAAGDFERHPVYMLKPEQPHVLTGKFRPDGSPETVACGTCHVTKEPNVKIASGEALKDFHPGLKYAHGNLTCLSCHNSDDYDQLRLADGRALPFPQTMTLCAQCHGPQHRDYQRGSHGGMTGYWDLTKGPRTRNHCITCHDPHAPAYPQVMPVFKPLDAETKNSDGRPSDH